MHTMTVFSPRTRAATLGTLKVLALVLAVLFIWFGGGGVVGHLSCVGTKEAEYGRPLTNYVSVALLLAWLLFTLWSPVFWQRRKIILGVILIGSAFMLRFAIPMEGVCNAYLERSKVSAMNAYLRSLLAFEDDVRARSGKFTNEFGRTANRWGFRGVRLNRFTLTADGWTALVGHERTIRTCAAFVGSTALAPATQAREPACIPPPMRTISRAELLWPFVVLSVGLVLALSLGVQRPLGDPQTPT